VQSPAINYRTSQASFASRCDLVSASGGNFINQHRRLDLQLRLAVDRSQRIRQLLLLDKHPEGIWEKGEEEGGNCPFVREARVRSV